MSRENEKCEGDMCEIVRVEVRWYECITNFRCNCPQNKTWEVVELCIHGDDFNYPDARNFRYKADAITVASVSLTEKLHKVYIFNKEGKLKHIRLSRAWIDEDELHLFPEINSAGSA